MAEPDLPHLTPVPDPAAGRLSAAPSDAGTDGPPGRHRVEVGGERAGLVLVPPADTARRLVVVLHGAGGTPKQSLALLAPYAADAGLLLLAPASTDRTWDVIAGGYGPDVVRIDGCVAAVSARWRVRPGGYVLAGFSDGASYALCLGIGNGDLVDAVVAFSPGFAAPLLRVGHAPMFVSHGTGDRVLPVHRCSRRLVPRLRSEGHAVMYEEFAGGHEVPPAVAARAVAWLGGAGDRR